MVGKYKVITLCGSTRFRDAFLAEQKRLTLEGNIVISVGLFGHSGDNEVWEGMSEDTLTRTKEMLDDMHKRKIDMADEIFVSMLAGISGPVRGQRLRMLRRWGRRSDIWNRREKCRSIMQAFNWSFLLIRTEKTMC